jgi:16S rRNA (adenine1518-N6/adenine1519-N6)-dimethyltransferase
VERLFTVPAGAFQPRPKVDSALLRLVPLEQPLVRDGEVPAFRRLVVGLFGFRRKQLLRALRELTGWSPPPLEELLGRVGIASSLRPEVVPPEGFVRLLRELVDGGWRSG